MSLTIFVKSVADRTFTGYISVEDIDLDGEIVPIQVLDEAFGPYLKRGGHLMLVHKAIPVGKITQHFITKHPNTGLKAIAVYGMIFNDGGSVYDEVWDEFVNPTDVVGFSIGGKPLAFHMEAYPNKTKLVKVYDKIELHEISVVCKFENRPNKPANQHAHLIGLGHLAVGSATNPIATKSLVIKMTKDKDSKEETKEIIKEEKPADDKEEEKKDEPEDVGKSIRTEINREAEKMMGGTTALKLLQEEKIEKAKFQAQVQVLLREKEDLVKKLERQDEDFTLLSKQLKAAEIAVETWKDLFQKNISNEETLKRVLDSQHTVVNEGMMPPDQGVTSASGIGKMAKDKVSQDAAEYLYGDKPLNDDEVRRLVAQMRGV